MSGPLLTANQLAQVQKIAMSGMQTAVTIQRETFADTVYEDQAESSYTTVGTCLGWLFSKPTPTNQEDNGQLITVNTYRLYVPVGTDIQARDQVLLNSGSYIVTDTTAGSTWPALLNCSLRQKE